MRLAKTAASIALGGLVLFWGSDARSDTFRLTDGTVVICKIIEETDDHYVIANSYGTFTVKKTSVKEKYVTRSYKEDVKIQEKMKIKVDEATVKKDVEAGLKRKKKKEEENGLKKMVGAGSILIRLGREPDWFFGSIGMSVAYYGTVSPGLRSRVPGGFSFQLTYDQGFEGLMPRGNMLIPGIRFEAGFLDLERKGFYTSPYRISGGFAQAGPLWAFPSVNNRWGRIVVAGLPGAGFFEAFNRDVSEKKSGVHFTCTALAGYEYSFQAVSVAVHVRYLYIMDGANPYHGIGGSVGFSYRLWDAPVLK